MRDLLDNELLRTGIVDAALFEHLKEAHGDVRGRGPQWVRARLVPLLTRLYFGMELVLHDPWRSAPIEVRSAHDFQSWVDRHFAGSL